MFGKSKKPIQFKTMDSNNWIDGELVSEYDKGFHIILGGVEHFYMAHYIKVMKYA